MDNYVECRLCGEQIYFENDCLLELGRHLYKKHPEASITHFSLPNEQGDSLSGPYAALKEINNEENGFPDLKQLAKFKKAKAVNIHKTTVETWQPSTACVACPHCSKSDRPFIRKQKSRVAYSHLGAFCLMTLWPLCFLPIVMRGVSNIDVCCRHCGHIIGTYDRKLGKLIPSKNQAAVEIPSLLTEISCNDLNKQ